MYGQVFTLRFSIGEQNWFFYTQYSGRMNHLVAQAVLRPSFPRFRGADAKSTTMTFLLLGETSRAAVPKQVNQ